MKSKFSFVPIVILLTCFSFAWIGNKVLYRTQHPQAQAAQTVSPAEYTHDVTAQDVPVLSTKARSESEVLTAQIVSDTTITEPPGPSPESSSGWIAFLKEYWTQLSMALVAFLEVVVRLTPTNTDNSILGLVKNILDWLIPNRRAGGGVHL